MEKQKIEELINKIIKANELKSEVNKEIETCGIFNEWHIYYPSDFKAVCRELNLDFISKPVNEKFELIAYYNNIKIISFDYEGK